NVYFFFLSNYPDRNPVSYKMKGNCTSGDSRNNSQWNSGQTGKQSLVKHSFPYLASGCPCRSQDAKLSHSLPEGDGKRIVYQKDRTGRNNRNQNHKDSISYTVE